MPFAKGSTPTFGSLNGRKVVITLLSLALIAKIVLSTSRVWKKPFLTLPTTTDLECSEATHPKNVRDYGKGSPRLGQSSRLSDMNQTVDQLNRLKNRENNLKYRPLGGTYSDTWPGTYRHGKNWPYEGNR